MLTNIVYLRATSLGARFKELPRGLGFLNYKELRYFVRVVVV